MSHHYSASDPYHSHYHHQASAYPHLYQSSAYSLPLQRHHSSRPYSRSPSPSAAYIMPTYYVDKSTRSPYHSHRDSSRSRSLSRSPYHSATGHAPPVVYTTSTPTYSRDYAYGDSGRHRRSTSVGRSGQYYYPSGYQTGYQTSGYRSGHSGSHSHTPQYVYPSTSGRRRSHSTSHHRTPQVVDVRHTGGYRDHRPSVSFVSTILANYQDNEADRPPIQSDGGHYHSHEPIGDRVRRWFGIAPAHHHSSSRGYEYADARTGRPVDRSGRRIYQV